MKTWRYRPSNFKIRHYDSTYVHKGLKVDFYLLLQKQKRELHLKHSLKQESSPRIRKVHILLQVYMS